MYNSEIKGRVLCQRSRPGTPRHFAFGMPQRRKHSPFPAVAPGDTSPAEESGLDWAGAVT